MVVKFPVDTNIAIYQLQNRLAERLPEGRYFLSIISEIELLAYPGLTTAEEQGIKTLLKAIEIVTLTDSVKQETIRIKRDNNLKLPDAIIIATARINGCVLLTNDQQLAKSRLIDTKAFRLR